MEWKRVEIPDARDRPLLAAEETAAILGVSRRTVYDMLQRGDLPRLELGRRKMVPTARLRRLLGLDETPEGLHRALEELRAAATALGEAHRLAAEKIAEADRKVQEARAALDRAGEDVNRPD